MLTAIGDVMREAYRREWITTRDGNISVRQGKNFYITPSGGRKTILHPEHILRGTIGKDGISIKGRVSGEFVMHQLIHELNFQNGGGTLSVVHLHPTYTIAAMLAGFDLRVLSFAFPELSRYTKVGDPVGVFPVCSTDLALETFSGLVDNDENEHLKLTKNIVGQQRHGVTAIAKNPWDAFEHIERLEHVCKITLISGISPTILSAQTKC